MNSEEINFLGEIRTEFTKPFVLLKHSSIEMKAIQLANFFDNLGFILLIAYLALFMHQYVGLSDVSADIFISLVATIGGAISFILLGCVVDYKGVRWTMIVGSLIMIVARLFYFVGIYIFPLRHGFFSLLNFTVCLGITLSVVAAGMLVPARYAAMAKYGDKETAQLGYAILFTIYNFAVVAAGLVSAFVIDKFGFIAPFWAALISTVIAFFVILTAFHGKSEEVKKPETLLKKNKWTGIRSVKEWITSHPLGDIKFLTFILCSVPVAVLLSQFWFSFPQYITRAIPNIGLPGMQFFSFSLNSIFLILMVPVFPIVFLDKSTFSPVFKGTLIMALSPIVLIFFTTKTALVFFIFMLSVGEAMWQPKYIQFATEMAPPYQTGSYIGASQIPANIAQILAGVIGGCLIQNFCPDSKNTEHSYWIWVYFLIVTMTAVLGLILWKSIYVKLLKDDMKESDHKNS